MKQFLYIGSIDVVGRTLIDRFGQDGFDPYHLAPRGSEVYGAGAEVDPLDPKAWTDALRDLEPDVVALAPSWRRTGAFVDSDADEWRDALAQNVESATYALQSVGERMVERGAGGHIVGLLHVAALVPYRDLTVFGTTVAALKALLGMLAVELAPHGIAVNSLAQGFSEDGGPAIGRLAMEVVENDTPRGKRLVAAEVADACRLLTRAAGVSLTGAVLPVDGGHRLTRGRVGPAPFGES